MQRAQGLRQPSLKDLGGGAERCCVVRVVPLVMMHARARAQPAYAFPSFAAASCVSVAIDPVPHVTRCMENLPADCCCARPQCGKTVYAAEKRVENKKLYHKECFSCVTCGKVLSADFGFTENEHGEEALYCLPHQKQMKLKVVTLAVV